MYHIFRGAQWFQINWGAVLAMRYDAVRCCAVSAQLTKDPPPAPEPLPSAAARAQSGVTTGARSLYTIAPSHGV